MPTDEDSKKDEAEQEKPRRRKKTKNKIVFDDPYMVPAVMDEDDDADSIPDEKVSEQYLQMLFESWEAKEKEKDRKKLA